MTRNQNFTVYGQPVPRAFDVRTLSKRLYTSKGDAQSLVTDWLRRRWLRRTRLGQYAKTKRFGRNDLTHLRKEVFPRARWTRRDVMNARLDELIEQHNQRKNKGRRSILADQIEEVMCAGAVEDVQNEEIEKLEDETANLER